MKTIAFFNNKGGVGKTSLVYHLAWMFIDMGLRVVAVDLDPQANLSSMFLPEERLEQLWPEEEKHSQTILGAIQPIISGKGDIASPHLEGISENLVLLVGDLGLSGFEGKLSESWPKCLDSDNESYFRIMTAFFRVIEKAAQNHNADLVLVDVGPNLGAINRSALIASQHVILPLAPDLFSLQGLRNLGPTLCTWRKDWEERLKKAPNEEDLSLPDGKMAPSGYIVMQHSIKDRRPIQAYLRWMKKIPAVYRESVLLNENCSQLQEGVDDPYCLATLKHYRSLMPLAMDAHKPMFSLKSADGAFGSHIAAAIGCYRDFENLARNIAKACGVSLQTKASHSATWPQSK